MAHNMKANNILSIITPVTQFVLVLAVFTGAAMLFSAGPNAMWMMLAVGGVSATSVAAISFVSLGKAKRWLGAEPWQFHELFEKASDGDSEYFSDTAGENAGLFGEMNRSIHAVLECAKTASNCHSDARLLKIAMNQSSSAVMMADKDLNIIYLNSTLERMFGNVQGELQKHIPGFSSSNLLGKNIDVFHQNPQKQRGMLANLTTSHKAEFSVGDVDIGFIAHPLFGENGERSGFFVEWDDYTDRNQIEKDIKEISFEALGGNLSKRIPMDNQDDYFRPLAEVINEILSINEHVVSEIGTVVRSMAKGNLKARLEYDYGGVYEELKVGLNGTIDKLAEVLGSVGQSADIVNNGARDISTGNMNLQKRTVEQANNLEKTAAAVEEITGTVRHNAENARQANELSHSARVKAEQGGEVVASAVKAMSEINQSSSKISDITSVIDEIAFQTNLLALNAAVEAAHAGDQGKGFAVVASEVRNLAQRSAEAAKEIKELIEDSVVKVNSGTKLVDSTGTALEEIVEASQKVSNIISEIDSANQEQSVGIEQVNQSMLRMDQMTQENSRLVEKAADSAATLDDQSELLSQKLSFFSVAQQAGFSTAAAEGPRTERRAVDRPWSTTADPAASGGIDIAAAKSKHLSWKNRIRGFLQGKESLTMDQAVSHRDCDLGKWIYSEGMDKFGSLQQMQELESQHADLHGEIKSIISLKEQGNDAEANNRYSNIESYSGRVVHLLDAIEDELESGAAQAADQFVEQKVAVNDAGDWNSF